MNNNTTPPHQHAPKKHKSHSDSSQRHTDHDSMNSPDTNTNLDQKARIANKQSKHQDGSSSAKRSDTSQPYHEDDSEGSSGTTTDAGLEALLAYEQSKHHDSSLAKRSDSPYIQLKEELKRSMKAQTFGGVLDNDGNRLTREEAEALLAKELPEFYSLIERDLMYTQADAFIRNHTKLANQTSDSASTDSPADDYNIDNQPTGPNHTPKR